MVLGKVVVLSMLMNSKTLPYSVLYVSSVVPRIANISFGSATRLVSCTGRVGAIADILPDSVSVHCKYCMR